MNTKELSFISDEYIIYCINELIDTYSALQVNTDLKNFYKNKVDPIKAFFDMQLKGLEFDDYIALEVTRQKDKTISNAIGTFHEKLIGGINSVEDMEWLQVGHETGVDVKNENNTIFAEIKNKFNTVKGEDLKNVYKKLEDLALKNPNATCYFVQIIAKKSINEPWTLSYTDKQQKKKVPLAHPRVKIISADKFYELLTGDSNAFLKVCFRVHTLLSTINLSKLTNNRESTVLKELESKVSNSGLCLMDQLYKDTFNTYLGFKDM